MSRPFSIELISIYGILGLRRNVVEQDHRFVKRWVNPGLGFGVFDTAQRTIQGDEAMDRLRKGQLEGVIKGDVLAQNRATSQLFGVAAYGELTTLFSHSYQFLQHNRNK